MATATRAVVATAYGGPEVLRVVEVETQAPGPGQVLVEMRAAGVNPADWKSYSGAWGTDPDRLPLRVGFEVAGVVVAVGPEVDGVAVGDEVMANPVTGAYADRVVVRASSVVAKPASVDWPQAGALLLAGSTAWEALATVKVGAGDTVLVHGASGAVGSLATQLARLRGARVIGTASPANHDLVDELGAASVAYGPGLEDRVRALAPQGVDAVVDTAGTGEALDVSVALAPARRVATVAGFAHGSRLGVHVVSGNDEAGTRIRAEARGRLAELAGTGRLRVRVDTVHRLDHAAQAHREGMRGTRGKIVLVP